VAPDGDKVTSLNYGKVTSIALDPIEKKPLNRFHPGSRILSVGSFGCNLTCPWCQNHEISRASPAGFRTVLPEQIADEAARLAGEGNIGVAYTYNEPLVGIEFVRDTARLVRARGMKNVLVTNGYANRRQWETLLPLIDAMNVDLKGYGDGFYRRIGGDLETVKENIRLAAGRCHVEVTCLLIDGENDAPEEMAAMADFLADVSPELPLHISRFFPRYRYAEGHEATRLATMRRFEDIAKARLRHVYLGNV
jgi:pyruvate formate lyase activating enzyme